MSGRRRDKGKGVAGSSRRGTSDSQPTFRLLDTEDTPALPYPTVFPSPPPATSQEIPTATSGHPLDDSTQTPEDYTCSTASGVDRLFIQPRNHEFSAQSRCARRIGKIIEKKFTGPWKSYKNVPLDVRDLWFSMFEQEFTWNEEDAAVIRRIFDTVGSNCLKNRLYDAKTTKERPVWITERIWAQLQAEWLKEPYKTLCEKNKKNRSSNCGGQGFPKHVGGSITHMTHMDKLREKQGREPTLLETFMHTHSRMNPQGDWVWVDNRSRNFHSRYVEAFSSPSSEDGSNITPPMSTQIERWREIAGGSTKDRVYGLAGMARSQPTRLPGSSSSQREKELESEVNGLKEKMNAQQVEIEQMRARMASMDQMQATLAFLMAQQFHGPSSLPFLTPSPTIPFPAPLHGPSAHQGEGTGAFAPTSRYPLHPTEQENSSTDDD